MGNLGVQLVKVGVVVESALQADVGEELGAFDGGGQRLGIPDGVARVPRVDGGRRGALGQNLDMVESQEC